MSKKNSARKAVKPIKTVTSPKKCPTCKGTGRDPNTTQPHQQPLNCNDCGGTGTAR